MREKKPEIKIHGLHPINDGFIHSYEASWAEQGIIAYAYLDPIDDDPSKGYRLDTFSRRESERGQMGNRQKDLVGSMEQRIRERMMAEMQVAGWQIVSKTEKPQPIWRYRLGAQANQLARES